MDYAHFGEPKGRGFIQPRTYGVYGVEHRLSYHVDLFVRGGGGRSCRRRGSRGRAFSCNALRFHGFCEIGELYFYAFPRAVDFGFFFLRADLRDEPLCAQSFYNDFCARDDLAFGDIFGKDAVGGFAPFVCERFQPFEVSFCFEKRTLVRSFEFLFYLFYDIVGFVDRFVHEAFRFRSRVRVDAFERVFYLLFALFDLCEPAGRGAAFFLRGFQFAFRFGFYGKSLSEQRLVILAARKSLFRGVYYFRGQTEVFSRFESVARSRIADEQAERGLERIGVELHARIHDPVARHCVFFEARIVSGYDGFRFGL